MRDPDTGAAAVIQLLTAWVPRRRARAGPGAPPRARRLSLGRRYQRFFSTYFPPYFYILTRKVDKEWFGIQIKSLEEKLDRRNEKLR